MTVTLSTELTYIKGVGPHRAEVLAKRGLSTIGDLLGYLPFRYEDRIRFSRVAEAGLVRFRGRRDAMFHLLLQDDSGALHCKFFHGGYLEGRLRSGQRLVVHGKADFDSRRGRVEMVNPAFELLGDESGDSTEV